MDIQGEYTFDAPQALVWEALQDPNVLGSVLPGGQAFEQVGDNEYAGTLKVKVGPVQGKFKGKIVLSDIVEPTSYTMNVDGKGQPGFVKASGDVVLSAHEEEADKTNMAYTGKAQVGGRIASVGQRLMDSSAKAIIRQTLDGLNEYLSAKHQASLVGETVELEDAEAPSELEFAKNVAKDVVSDLFKGFKKNKGE